MFGLDKGILKEIVDKSFENAKENLLTLGKLMDDVTEDGTEIGTILSPSQMFDAVSNYLDASHSENVAGFKEFENKIHKNVLASPFFQQAAHDNEHGFYEIGLALASIGSKLMALENTEEEIVRERLDNNTLTREDATLLIKANLRGLPEDLVKKVQEIYDGVTPVAAKPPVKVTDKTSLMRLIESGNISAPTLYILLTSKEITADELKDSLDSETFAKTFTDVNNYAKANGKALIPVPAVQSQSKEEAHANHDCAHCPSRELCEKANEDLDAHKGQVADMMSKLALDETKCSEDEKIFRRAMDKGLVSEADITQAIHDERLNPFYIEAKMKHEDPAKYARISVEILRNKAPEMLRRMGPDPVQTILNKLRG